MKNKIRYYGSFSDDFFQTGQSFRLPEKYRWTPPRILSGLVYGAAVIFGGLYCRAFLHVRIRGAAKLRHVRGGLFLYGNHTQPVGDVIHPALACFPKRIYTLANPANLHLPVIGKLLPYLGALPVTDSISHMKQLRRVMELRIRRGHPVVIYPEAHLWEYCTVIRPFPVSSFKYPVRLGAPVYAMTTTYRRRRWGKRPAAVIYVDGPFPADGETPAAKAQSLHDQVYACMVQRSRESNCEYIRYLPKQT